MIYSDCRQLVETTYRKIKAYSKDAVNVTLMIIAHESGCGEHRRQIGAAEPALGLGQMERPTFNTVMEFSARIRTYLERAGYDYDSVKFEHLETDDVLAIIFIRARLSMDTNPLPSDLVSQAVFCKRYWNAGGKASSEKYLNDYERWKYG